MVYENGSKKLLFMSMPNDSSSNRLERFLLDKLERFMLDTRKTLLIIRLSTLPGKFGWNKWFWYGAGDQARQSCYISFNCFSKISWVVKQDNSHQEKCVDASHGLMRTPAWAVLWEGHSFFIVLAIPHLRRKTEAYSGWNVNHADDSSVKLNQV